MSRTCIGYTGEGRTRTPVYRDEGPASASTPGDPVAALGALSATGIVGPGERLTGGAGPIERRQVTEAERDARRPQATPTQRDWNGHAPAIAAHHQPEERPVSDHAHRELTPLEQLAEAAADAALADAGKRAADEAWAIAREALQAAYAAVEGIVEPAEAGRSMTVHLVTDSNAGRATVRAMESYLASEAEPAQPPPGSDRCAQHRGPHGQEPAERPGLHA